MGSREPTYLSIFNCFAGFIVTSLRASFGSSSPYWIAFAASVFNLLASSSSSELNDTKSRIGGTVSSSIYLMMQGIQILRIHDVDELLQGVKVFKNLLKY